MLSSCAVSHAELIPQSHNNESGPADLPPPLSRRYRLEQLATRGNTVFSQCPAAVTGRRCIEYQPAANMTMKPLPVKCISIPGYNRDAQVFTQLTVLDKNKNFIESKDRNGLDELKD